MQIAASWGAAIPGGYAAIAISMLVFMAGTLFALGVMSAFSARNDVKRRATTISAIPDTANKRTLRYHSLQVTERLKEYTDRHFVDTGEKEDASLRNRLVQAGFLDSRAPLFYLVSQVTGGLSFASLLAASGAFVQWGGFFWLAVWVGGLIGYLAPRFYLSRRIAHRQLEHRYGFPDFMDLMAVCVNAGLSMEAALDRVGRELRESYPSLGSNIYISTLELRAGRSLGETLKNLGDRLGLDEARGFATLLQQSQDLGSSLTDTLRVYSDDMRHMRMASAEEKAYSLPAKLSVPLILCIFPVIIIVILLPVYVRVSFGIY